MVACVLSVCAYLDVLFWSSRQSTSEIRVAIFSSWIQVTGQIGKGGGGRGRRGRGGEGRGGRRGEQRGAEGEGREGEGEERERKGERGEERGRDGRNEERGGEGRGGEGRGREGPLVHKNHPTSYSAPPLVEGNINYIPPLHTHKPSRSPSMSAWQSDLFWGMVWRMVLSGVTYPMAHCPRRVQLRRKM